MPKKLQTWQVWRQFKLHLGESFLMQVMGKSNARTIRMYSQDPRTTDDRCKDPLEALHIIFTEADEIGRADIAHKAIDYLQSALSENTYDLPAVKDLLPTLAEEKLADYSAVSNFQRAIDNGGEVDLVETLLNEAKAELDRTFSKWLQG